MLYNGRELDAASLWASFVDFPQSMPSSGFAPLVQCPNPEHQTDKKHFQVNLDKPMVHCFAMCGISGSYEKAISMILGVNEREAKRKILQHCRVKLGPQSRRKRRDHSGRVHSVQGERKSENAEPISLDYDTFLPAVALEYLEKRGISSEGISRYGLGWDQDERRLVVPAHDERGVLRFLIKRATREKDWPKYLYWPEGSSKTAVLFGACYLDSKEVSSQGLVLCEGSFDAIRLQQYGVQAAAILGTGLSPRQRQVIERMRPRKIFMMFDKDGAGVRNILMAERRLTKVPLFVCLYPRGKSDPAEMSRQEVEKSISNAIPLVMFKKRLPPEALKNRKEHALA